MPRERPWGKPGPVLVGGLYAGPEALHGAPEGPRALGHGPDRGSVANRDARQLGLTKVGDGIPCIRLDQAEEWLSGDGEGPLRNLKSDDDTVERSPKRREIEIAGGDSFGRLRALELCLET